MTLRILRVRGGYVASKTDRDLDQVVWEHLHPVSADELIALLAPLGLHQQDVGDAFCETDPGWVER